MGQQVGHRKSRAFKLTAVAAAVGLVSGMSMMLVAATASAAPVPSAFNWNKLTPAASPPPSSDVAMADDTALSQVVEFGGLSASDSPLGDTWTWNGTTWSETSFAQPPARYSASMAYDAHTNQLLLFGGLGAGETPLGDTWIWSGTGWTALSPVDSPPARYAASMTYDPATQNIVLFGGLESSGFPLADTWTWNGSNWTPQSPTLSPPARHSASLAYDPVSTDLILFGGCRVHVLQPCNLSGTGEALGDTWSWNGTTWARLSPTTSPSARTGASMATDTASAVNGAVLFGGETAGGTLLGDTWNWTGTNWTRLSPTTNPPVRFSAGLAYDSVSGDLLLFGGHDAALDDTWDLSFSATPAATTTSVVSSLNPSAAGGAVTFTVTVAPAPDGGTVSVSSDGSPICTVAVIAGVATCPTSFSTANSYSIVATYNGDPDFDPSTSSPPLSQVVQSAPPTATTTSVRSSLNPSVAGGAVTFTVTVAPAPDAGKVSVSSYGSPISGCTALSVIAGVATCPTSFSAVNSYPIVAAYTGDLDFDGSTSSPPLSQVVQSAPPTATTTSVRSSLNPSVAGGAVTFTVTVAPEPNGGTVSVTRDGLSIPGCSGRVLAGGKGTCTASFAAGSYSIAAAYTGDGDFRASTARPVVQSVLPGPVPPAPVSAQGYWMVASDGGVFAGDAPFGNAHFYGSTGNVHLNAPVVGMAATPDGHGYWLVASDGGIFSFGNAHFYGSTGNIHLNAPVVGMAATPDGHGYWMVASDGGIFSFGDAHFYGSTGNVHLNKPVIGMAADPNGDGYWLDASDGGVFSFGDAKFHGSTGNVHLNAPIVGMAATPDGNGYWMVASDGGIFSFGNARFYGSTGNVHLDKPVVGMAANFTGGGYWLVASDGGVFTFGNAPFFGSLGNLVLNRPILGLALSP
jgi:hypothetical protein